MSGDFPNGGFDSLSAMELSNTLSSTFGVQLPGTLVFDYPSISAMSDFIHGLLMHNVTGGVPSVAAPLPSSDDLITAGQQGIQRNRQLVNVIIAARLPKGQPQQDVLECSDGIRLVPFDRWDLERQLVSALIAHHLHAIQAFISQTMLMSVQNETAQLPVRYGGFLQDIDQFDTAVFGITHAEAELMDPQHRLLLEVRMHGFWI